MRISEEMHRSRIRIADLRVEIVRAIGVVLDKHPDQLTHEEILAALLDVSAGQIARLLSSTED